jgi:hypothetical protein
MSPYLTDSNPFQGLLGVEELGIAAIRCNDCFGGELLCEDCCVRNHVNNPLHMIEVIFVVRFQSFFRA